jgi:hypothetical protein
VRRRDVFECDGRFICFILSELRRKLLLRERGLRLHRLSLRPIVVGRSDFVRLHSCTDFETSVSTYEDPHDPARAQADASAFEVYSYAYDSAFPATVPGSFVFAFRRAYSSSNCLADRSFALSHGKAIDGSFIEAHAEANAPPHFISDCCSEPGAGTSPFPLADSSLANANSVAKRKALFKAEPKADKTAHSSTDPCAK